MGVKTLSINDKQPAQDNYLHGHNYSYFVSAHSLQFCTYPVRMRGRIMVLDHKSPDNVNQLWQYAFV